MNGAMTEITVLPQVDLGKNKIPVVEPGKGAPIEENIFHAKNIDVYGDLHGKIDARLNPNNLAVINGDVADGNPGSWQRVQESMELVKKGNGKYIIGNHEALVMSAMTPDTKGRDKQSLLMWFYNGGYMTANGAGVNLGAFDDKVTRLVSARGGDPKDLVARQDAAEMLLNKYFTEPPDPKDAAAVQAYDAAQKEWSSLADQLLVQVRGNDNLKVWTNFLKKNGDMAVVADGVLVYHAALPADEKGNLLDIGGFGKGWVGMMHLQELVRAGDPNAIHFLATGGDASPVWGDREKYIALMNSPEALHEYRRQLNKQLEALGYGNEAIKQIASGHTPVNIFQEQGVSNIGKTTSLRSTDAKVVVLDGGAKGGGDVLGLRVSMDNKGAVSSSFVNLEKGTPQTSVDGQEVKAIWTVDTGKAETPDTSATARADESALPNASEAIAAVQKTIDRASQGDLPDSDVFKMVEDSLVIFLKKAEAFSLLKRNIDQLEARARRGQVTQDEYNKQRNHIYDLERVLKKEAAKIDTELDRMQKEGPIERRALAYDLRAHLNRREEAQINNELKELEGYLPHTKSYQERNQTQARINDLIEDKVKLTNYRSQIEDGRKQMIAEAHAKDPNSPEKIGDQVVRIATQFETNLKLLKPKVAFKDDGTVDTDAPLEKRVHLDISKEIKQKLVTDPLDVIEDELLAAVDSKNIEDKKDIARALGYRDERKIQEIAKMLTLENIEKQLGIDNAKSFFKKGGLGGLFLLLMWLKLASDREKQGHGGGGGMTM